MSEIERVIEKHIKSVDETKLVYTLRKLHVRYTSSDAMFALKIFIALRELGMSLVSTTTFMHFYGTTKTNVLAMLHRLGDKGVLTLVKNERPGASRYCLSEKFVSLWTAQPTSINT